MTASPGYPSRLHGPEQMREYRQARRIGRYSPANVRAVLWAWRGLRSAARSLAADGLGATVPRPPRVPSGARRGVEAVLRRTSPTCLERSLVLQTWLAAHGVPCEVVVGVAPTADGVAAHAWLDVEAGDETALRYVELHRLAP
ncbi:lasso peptide biosynthesis B2 protein [Modestobacter italicus]|uniref:lasso peptide biosynthesis B2 protein n=1 Tax=Modestobacter italicus (strain DSM 44449 / CECT 9708 / BC 501) TaxID=2732864 RepID=UPI00059F7D1C|nr:lasso peptide biosynthesis B2 protein [Modestobacter marinus]